MEDNMSTSQNFPSAQDSIKNSKHFLYLNVLSTQTSGAVGQEPFSLEVAV